MLPVGNFGIGYIKSKIGGRAKEMRLANNLSRKSLSEKSLVSESTIKRLETKGEMSLDNLVRISIVLGCVEGFEHLFSFKKEVLSLDDLSTRERKRGRK